MINFQKFWSQLTDDITLVVGNQLRYEYLHHGIQQMLPAHHGSRSLQTGLPAPVAVPAARGCELWLGSCVRRMSTLELDDKGIWGQQSVLGLTKCF